MISFFCIAAAALGISSGPVSDPSGADSLASAPLRAIERQLSVKCTYYPECSVFFADAVDRVGLLPALVFTADRITRSGRIGSTGRGFVPAADGLRHEGLEAYLPRLKKNTVSVPAALPVVSHGVASAASVGGEYDFAMYLLDNELYKDAGTLLSSSWAPSDTLDFLRGKLAFDTRRLGEAAAYFLEVDTASPFAEHALFHSVVADAHLGRYDEALKLLEGYSGQYKELSRLQEAGLALLRSDPSAFRVAASDFTHSSYALSDSEDMLERIYKARFESFRKSPAVAALLSAAIPGAGKIYAGKTGEGIASFLYVGTLAAMTAENWIISGPKNWKTLLFGITSSLFYIGNIYGSYISVSIYNDDLRNAQNTAVLYHIHIPLRSVFN